MLFGFDASKARSPAWKHKSGQQAGDFVLLWISFFFFFVVSRFQFVVMFVPAVPPLCLWQVSCQYFHLEIPTCRVRSMIVHSPHLCFASKVSTWTWIHLTKSDATWVVAKLDRHSSQVWLLYCKYDQNAACRMQTHQQTNWSESLNHLQTS